MSFGIIIKGKNKPKISRESKGEHRMERRAKMLKQKGYGSENIAAMMYTPQNNIRKQHIDKWLKHPVKKNEMDLTSGKNI